MLAGGELLENGHWDGELAGCLEAVLEGAADIISGLKKRHGVKEPLVSSTVLTAMSLPRF